MHPQTRIPLLMRRLSLDKIWFLDAWPFAAPIVVVTEPQTILNMSRFNKFGLEKPSRLKKFTAHIFGATGMINLEGQEWKHIRTMFNPAFAPGHLKSLVDIIADECTVFEKQLECYAVLKRTCLIEEVASKLTFAIIAAIVLDVRLDCQLNPNDIYDDFRALVQWSPQTGFNIFKIYDPRRPLMRWYFSSRLKKGLQKVIKERCQAGQKVTPMKKSTNMLELIFEDYCSRSGTGLLNSHFETIAIDKSAVQSACSLQSAPANERIQHQMSFVCRI